jgi:branched-chain amino acid aminotransferase
MAALVKTKAPFSRTWTFFEGEWVEGNVALMGPRTHGAWMASGVFDGGRVFEGVSPDMDLHMARVNRSAELMGLQPVVALDDWMGLVRDGAARFDGATPLYVRPMYWAESGYGGGVMFDPDSTTWCLSIYETPMPTPTGVSATLSPFRRPTPESAMLGPKCGANYPNGARALWEAKTRGFDNCVMLDMMGSVAEFANANLMIARDGVVFTPAPNGAFLNGITRQRMIGLLRADGVEVVETILSYVEVLGADEIFSCGNFNKVAPVTRIETRDLQAGPLYRRARELYWDFAHRR